MSHQIIFAGSAVLCAGLAAAHDLKDRRIPNVLTGSALLLGLLLHLGLEGFASAGFALLASLLAGSVFLLFYVVGGMGAGDVKLMAAIGALAGMGSLKQILLATVISGAVFALALAVVRGRLRETVRNTVALVGHHQAHGLQTHPELNVRNAATLRLPYALPIAVGCAFAFFHLMLGAAR